MAGEHRRMLGGNALHAQHHRRAPGRRPGDALKALQTLVV
jgi:hypothetical protein